MPENSGKQRRPAPLSEREKTMLHIILGLGALYIVTALAIALLLAR